MYRLCHVEGASLQLRAGRTYKKLPVLVGTGAVTFFVQISLLFSGHV